MATLLTNEEYLEQLKIKRQTLALQMGSGIVEIEDEGKRVRYSQAEATKMLAWLDTEIARIERLLGQTPTAPKIKFNRYSPAPGYRC